MDFLVNSDIIYKLIKKFSYSEYIPIYHPTPYLGIQVNQSFYWSIILNLYNKQSRPEDLEKGLRKTVGLYLIFF